MLPSYPLRVVEKTGHRYLVNASARIVRRLVFTTGCRFIDWDGTVIDSPAPRYEVRDIPADCHVRFEAVDPDEGGITWWQADEILWDDGSCDRAINLHEEDSDNAGALPGQQVELPRVLLEMVPNDSACL